MASVHDEKWGDEEVETYLAKTLPAPKTSSSMFDGVVPLEALDVLIDYESVGTKGESPSPGARHQGPAVLTSAIALELFFGFVKSREKKIYYIPQPQYSAA